MAEWKDATSYTRSARQGWADPRTWELEFNSEIRLIVTRRLHLDGWWGFCDAIQIESHDLGDVDIIEAQSRMVTAYERAVGSLMAARTMFQEVRRASIMKREGRDDGQGD